MVVGVTLPSIYTTGLSRANQLPQLIQLHFGQMVVQVKLQLYDGYMITAHYFIAQNADYF